MSLRAPSVATALGAVAAVVVTVVVLQADEPSDRVQSSSPPTTERTAATAATTQPVIVSSSNAATPGLLVVRDGRLVELDPETLAERRTMWSDPGADWWDIGDAADGSVVWSTTLHGVCDRATDAPPSEMFRLPPGGGAVERLGTGSSPAVSSDGRFLAYATSNRALGEPDEQICLAAAVVVRDLATGEERSWRANVYDAYGIGRLSFSPDGQFLAVSRDFEGGHVLVLDTEEDNELDDAQRLDNEGVEHPWQSFSAATYLDDGRISVAASCCFGDPPPEVSSQILVFDPETGAHSQLASTVRDRYYGPTDRSGQGIVLMRFTRDSRTTWIRQLDGSEHVVEGASSFPGWTKPPASPVAPDTFEGPGVLLVRDNRLVELDPTTGEERRTIWTSPFESEWQIGDGADGSVVFSVVPKSNEAYTCEPDGRPKSRMYRLAPGATEVEALGAGWWPAISPDGARLAYAMPNSFVGGPPTTYGKLGFCGGEAVVVRDLSTGDEQSYAAEEETLYVAGSFSFAPDGQSVAVTHSYEGSYQVLLDLARDEVLADAEPVAVDDSIDGPRGSSGGGTYLDDGRLVVGLSCCYGEIETGSQLVAVDLVAGVAQRFHGPESVGYGARVERSGEWLLLQRWDVTTETYSVSVRQPDGEEVEVAIRPNTCCEAVGWLTRR